MNMRCALVCLLALAGCCAIQANGQRFPGFSGIKDIVHDGLSRLVGEFDNRLDNLMGDLKNFTRSLKEVAECYEPQLKEELMDIFNGSLSFRGIIGQYYRAFPDKMISREKIQTLLNSTKEMITYCVNRARNETTKVGFTELSDMSDEEIRGLMGVQIPNEPRTQKRLSANDAACQPDTRSALPRSFDWRDQNVVTSVKNQGQCGSCWTFAALGALESALVKANQAPISVDLSEQHLVDCGKSQGCQGGYAKIAFDYVKSNGIGTESRKPYVAQEQTCRAMSTSYSIRDYCVRSKFRYTYSSVAEELTDDTIARALVQNGPLYIAVDASPLTSRNYRGGVQGSSGCSTQINHAVLLVGYDGADNSWIIKNSWGPYWGDKGYFKVARGSNVCGVNTEIAWPIL